MTAQKNLILLCLFSLFLVVSAPAQNPPVAIPTPVPVPVPTLNEAKTLEDVDFYVNYEVSKLNLPTLTPKERSRSLADVVMPASDKVLEIAKTPEEKSVGYSLKFFALLHRVKAEVEGADQKLETFIKEAAAIDEVKEMADQWQFVLLATQTQIKGIAATEQKLETFLKEFAAKAKTAEQTHALQHMRFFLFSEKAQKAAASPENFAQFKTELKSWINQDMHLLSEIIPLSHIVAYQNKIPTETFVKELTEYIQSPECKLPAEAKQGIVAYWQEALKLAPGIDPKLYGKTLDGKDFDWQSLRGKFVLIKFTATWCPDCKVQIPGLVEAYKKYHDKGLEVVSVYIGEESPNTATATAAIKQCVEEEKIPWIVLAEPLTLEAKKPEYGESYAVDAVPTFVLVDKEGKIMTPIFHEDEWKQELDEIFK
jgi:thiol-disulfide isomerase/thioredoxin